MTENTGYWVAVADYADGTHIEQSFPYRENGSYSREEARQYQLECWLIEEHPDCTYYSVSYTEEEQNYDY